MIRNRGSNFTAAFDDGTAERYHSIQARVLLLGGGKSPAFLAAQLFSALQQVVPDARWKYWRP